MDIDLKAKIRGVRAELGTCKCEKQRLAEENGVLSSSLTYERRQRAKVESELRLEIKRLRSALRYISKFKSHDPAIDAVFGLAEQALENK